LRLELLCAAGLLVGCGDDSAAPDAAPDAHPDASADAPLDAAADSALPSCDPAAILDLDGRASEDGGVKEALYMGTTRGAARELEPPPGCTIGAGGAPERVHHFTAPSSERVRVLASTDENGTDPNFDTVVYVRTACRDPATVVACNDDALEPGPRPLGSRAAGEVAGGTELYVVVDGVDAFAFGAYALRLWARPALPDGAPCDPTGATNVCRGTSICSRAGGTPHCAPGTAPTLGAVDAQILENGRSVRVVLAGGDVDGDAVATHVDALDASGMLLAAAERPLPTAALGQVSFGPLIAFAQDGFLDTISATQLRVWLLDAAGLTSVQLTRPLFPVALRHLGETCDPAGLSDLCQGELACTGAGATCAVAGATASACAAAPTITGSMQLAGTLNPGAGTFELACAYARGFDDRVWHIQLATPADLSATTDVAATSANLDTALALRRICTDPASQLACSDNIDSGNPRSRIALGNLAPGDYFLIVDGSRAGGGLVATGAFGLSIQITPR